PGDHALGLAALDQSEHLAEDRAPGGFGALRFLEHPNDFEAMCGGVALHFDPLGFDRLHLSVVILARLSTVEEVGHICFWSDSLRIGPARSANTSRKRPAS